MNEDKIPVELDPAILRVSMQMWRDATDLRMPVHDSFKVHFMENRRSLLFGFAKTGRAWQMMLRAMSAPGNAAELDALRAEVAAFVQWAEAGLAELQRLAEP